MGTREERKLGERLWGLNNQGQVLAASLHPLPKLGWAGVLPAFHALVYMEDMPKDLPVSCIHFQGVVSGRINSSWPRTLASVGC